ncbi:sugar transferase, partial [candidate division WOR-3 bacterium]|nr:sugar transferase [candidate division WOR-3 bacterium]
QIMLYPDPYDILTSKIEYQDIDGLTLIGLRNFPFSYWSTLFKRLFDITLSSIFLIIIIPILLIVAIFIKITSKGSILYLQNRVGEQGKLFNILKFRTMKENAEEETGPIFASPNDHRTTRIGKVLRKASIDELPQLFNVLKGDMSLVGPRPERPNFVKHFRDEVPRYIERHKVKPGITGWAQVHGLRGDSSIKERVKYDLFYIENWSIGMDVKIILQTLYTLIKGENAY